MTESGTRGGSPERVTHAVVERIARWLHVGEAFILLGVACVLLVAGLIVIVDAVKDLLLAVVGRSASTGILEIAENALLALILVELVNTLMIPSRGQALTPEPFLVIGIVVAVRELILIPLRQPAGHDSQGPVPPVIMEVLALGLLILMLGVVLVLLRRYRVRA